MTSGPAGSPVRVASAGGGQPSPPAAGVDVGTRHVRDADRVAHALVEAVRTDGRAAAWWAGLVVTTHVVGEAPRHVALGVTVPGPADDLAAVLADAAAAASRDRRFALVVAGTPIGDPDLRAGALEAEAAAASRASGRAVHYPGIDALAGSMTVADLLERSAVEAVVHLTGAEAPADARFVTREFVRPRWSAGRLVLDCRPAAGGVLVPFEVPDPTACCADHA